MRSAKACLHRLEAAIEERGVDSLEPSEVTVVEVMAAKGQGEKGE